ncbi:MAG: D-2-hydroxyacid dehydrogenase [Cellvibrionaceae bacterium]
MAIKIVFLDHSTIPSHITIPAPAFDCEWINYDLTNTEQIVDRAKDAEVIVVNKVLLSADIIKQLPQLKHIAVIATGFNNIDISACKQRGIAVTNTPGYSVNSVPEHALALIFALRRHLFAYQYSMQKGEWQDSPFFHGYLEQTLDLNNTQLGIIGGGDLGKATAKLASALGMKVVFSDRKNSAVSGKPNYLPFDELLKTSDVISLNCPLTKETENLITLTELKQMKQNALLINTARGGLVNEADLAIAINDNLIAGAGFDVASEEPIKADNPLLSLLDKPNFILTPHVAWSSDSALKRQAEIMIDNINQFSKGVHLNRVD